MEQQAIDIIEFFDWQKSQQFMNSKEFHRYVNDIELDFLQKVVYPMFYKNDCRYTSPVPFPLVLKDYSSKKPIFVIDTQYFSIIFLSYDNHANETCWEVSIQIKDHSFCDEKIEVFKTLYEKHYKTVFAKLEDMPDEFQYPKFNFYDNTTFSIEFWNGQKDFLFYKLLDLLRLY